METDKDKPVKMKLKIALGILNSRYRSEFRNNHRVKKY